MTRLIGGDAGSVESARLGGLLHDIGKVGIRDGVLLKAEALTPEEYDHVKEHPVIGARLVLGVPGLRAVREIVLHHHERLDGRGYPDGLKGARIPLYARMTAVADTYHALTTDRSYRPGFPPWKALEIIHVVKGEQLCPECVDLLVRLLEEEDGEAAALMRRTPVFHCWDDARDGPPKPASPE